MERIIHPNDNAREAKATLWIFEGSSLYVLIVSVALALASFRYACDRLGLGMWTSAGVGTAPLILASVYVLTLKVGKAKSYDIDFFRTALLRLALAIARTGLLLVRVELHGLGVRSGKKQHPYAE